MDPDPDLTPLPTPDPTPFFSDFKEAKKIFFPKVFSSNLYAGTLSPVLKMYFFAKILRKNFILQALFQSAQHLYEKREGSGSIPILLTTESGSWRPKNMRLLRIRIPNTGLLKIPCSGSRSVIRWMDGSADPDSYQNLTDPEHRKVNKIMLCFGFRTIESH
jgi:hypothetical protein